MIKEFKSVSLSSPPTGEAYKDCIVFIVKNDVDRPGVADRGFKDLFPLVKIDGVKYKTKGVESFATYRCGEGTLIGLMVYKK